MSIPRTSHKSKKIEIPPNALHYCPNYISLDIKARKDSNQRFRDHVNGRREGIVQCLLKPIADITNKSLGFQFKQHPEYLDNDDIINGAFKAMQNEINKWDGVQFSAKFKTSFNKTGKKMDAKTFDKIAKNHQDQTSWKISGNKFFAPYIAQAKQYFYAYCQCIMNIDENLRGEIYKFSCISYAVSLLTEKIKFNRTKPKPLIRHKTLVRSIGIHKELENLCPALKVKSFIVAAKKRRKQKDKKTTIIAADFHQTLLNCCNTLYREQKKKVYQLRGISMEHDMKEKEEIAVYPKDLMCSEDDDDDINSYHSYESPLYPIQSTHSTPSRSQSNLSREFQMVHPRTFSVRNEMKSDIFTERREQRRNSQEQNIRTIRNGLGMNSDLNRIERLQRENYALRWELQQISHHVNMMEMEQEYLLNDNMNITSLPQQSHLMQPQMLQRGNSDQSMNIDEWAVINDLSMAPSIDDIPNFYIPPLPKTE